MNEEKIVDEFFEKYHIATFIRWALTILIVWSIGLISGGFSGSEIGIYSMLLHIVIQAKVKIMELSESFELSRVGTTPPMPKFETPPTI